MTCWTDLVAWVLVTAFVGAIFGALSLLGSYGIHPQQTLRFERVHPTIILECQYQ